MPVLDESIRNRIVYVRDAIRSMDKLLQAKEELRADLIQEIAFCCAEAALLSLTLADELDVSADLETRMLRRELATALRTITDHLLWVQEWQSVELIRSHIQAAAKHASFISRALGLPEEKPVPDALENLSLIPQILPTELPVAAAQDAAAKDEEEQRLRKEIRALRELLASLVMERDHLIFVVCKELEAAYLREFGALNLEIYQADGELRYLRRKLEMLQAEANRGKKADTATVDSALNKEYEGFRKSCEEYARKVNAAEKERSGKTTAAEEERSGQTTAENRQTEAPEKPEEKTDRQKLLKKLYCAIVKAMHPDLHPDQDEQTKELFKRAIRAYKEGDLKTLREISGMLDADGQISAAYRLEELRKEKLRLLTMIRGIQAEIRTAKSRYPYTKKDILEDPARLEREKAALRERLEFLKQAASDYRLRIKRMEDTEWKN